MIGSAHPQSIRAVLDLNVIVSATIVPRGSSFHVWRAWHANEFALVISRGMVVELNGKLLERRLAERHRISPEEVWQTTRLLQTKGMMVDVPADEVIAVTGDPEDDLVLATARLAHADYLVTRDKRLLGLGEHAGTPIVDPLTFLSVLPPRPA